MMAPVLAYPREFGRTVDRPDSRYVEVPRWEPREPHEIIVID